MAHEISITKDGVAEAAFAVQPAWHGLGTVLPDAVTAEEMLVAAHLDWTVETAPMFVCAGNDPKKGERFEVSGHKAIRRVDTGDVLGVVSDSYRPAQNRDCLNLLESLREGGLQYEAAGALRGGRRIWFLARIPGDMEIGKADPVQRYVCVANAHDGSMALRCFATPVRVVCNNTLGSALNRADGAAAAEKGIALRHSTNIKAAIEEAGEAMQRLLGWYDGLAERFQGLAKKRVRKPKVVDYFEQLTPIRAGQPGEDPEAAEKREARQVKVREALWHVYTAGVGAAPGTAWGAYQAVTGYYSHERRFQSSKKRGGASAQERRFEALTMPGKIRRNLDRALSLAEQL